MAATEDHSIVTSDATAQQFHTIEQVAKQTQLTKRTLRYYEEVGLILPAERTEGNYRRYTDLDIQHIERIKELRDLLGFSLNDIREILDAEKERGQIKQAFQQETDYSTRVMQLDRADELIHEQIQLIQQKITGLEQMRSHLLLRLDKHAHKKLLLKQHHDMQ